MFSPQSFHHYSESFERVKMVFEKFQLAKILFRKLMKCFGADVFDENYKPGTLTLVSCLMAFLANFSDAYTIVISYPDFMTILKTTTLWGICIQVISYVFKNLHCKNKFHQYTHNTSKNQTCTVPVKNIRKVISSIFLNFLMKFQYFTQFGHMAELSESELVMQKTFKNAISLESWHAFP